MRTIICFSVMFMFTLLLSCSQEYYTYEGLDLKVFTDKNLRNASDRKEIQALDLSENSNEVSMEVYQLKELIYLNLNQKNLDSISSKICELTSLKILLLNNNSKVEIPECIFSMDNLEVLSLIACDLNPLPKGLSSMKNLKYLGIAGNYFTDEDLKTLQEELSNTKILYSID